MTSRVRLAVILVVCVVATVVAAPRKVLVLPLDGNADAATKAKLNASVQKLARVIDGQVSNGDTTFAETAAAVGCDPGQASCASTVLATLSVDEIVYGTVNTENGQTTVTVKRATNGAPVREQAVTIEAGDSPDKAAAGLQPVFGLAGGTHNGGSGSGTAPVGSNGSAGSAGSASGTPFFDTPERKLGVGLAAGGGVALIVGFSLWASESGLQTQINNHSRNTVADFNALRDLENKASTYAWTGNIMVVLGLAAGGAGAYYLWKDHKNRETTIMPAPAPSGTGVTLVLGGRW